MHRDGRLATVRARLRLRRRGGVLAVSGALMLDAAVYTDVGGLAELRSRAQAHDPKALRAAATRVEALFLQMMLKSMRAASPGDPIFGGDRMRFYRDLFDHQLSLDLARKSILGLGDTLVRQLGGVPPATAPGAGSRAAPPPLMPRSGVAPVVRPVAPPAAARAPDAVAPTPAAPRDFVDSLWSQARRAAGALGVAPELLVAQAALETGWGRAVIRASDGASSHNLFGIKANGEWRGARVTKTTLEYRAGAMRRVRAPFRAYHSVADGFDDYVKLIRENPRYRDAVGAPNPRAYVEALSAGGFATDPGYADKVLALMPRVRAIKERHPI